MEDASVYDSRHDDAMPIACNSVLFFGLTIFVSWVTNNNLSFFFSYQSDGRGQMVQCEEWIWLHQSVKKVYNPCGKILCFHDPTFKIFMEI
jgi:hypothetical protein